MAPPGSVTFSPVRIGATSAPWGVKPGVGAALGVFPWGSSFAPAALNAAGTRAVQIPWWTQEAGAFRQSATFVAGNAPAGSSWRLAALSVLVNECGQHMQVARSARGIDRARAYNQAAAFIYQIAAFAKESAGLERELAVSEYSRLLEQMREGGYTMLADEIELNVGDLGKATPLMMIDADGRGGDAFHIGATPPPAGAGQSSPPSGSASRTLKDVASGAAGYLERFLYTRREPPIAWSDARINSPEYEERWAWRNERSALAANGSMNSAAVHSLRAIQRLINLRDDAFGLAVYWYGSAARGYARANQQREALRTLISATAMALRWVQNYSSGRINSESNMYSLLIGARNDLTAALTLTPDDARLATDVRAAIGVISEGLSQYDRGGDRPQRLVFAQEHVAAGSSEETLQVGGTSMDDVRLQGASGANLFSLHWQPDAGVRRRSGDGGWFLMPAQAMTLVSRSSRTQYAPGTQIDLRRIEVGESYLSLPSGDLVRISTSLRDLYLRVISGDNDVQQEEYDIYGRTYFSAGRGGHFRLDPFNLHIIATDDRVPNGSDDLLFDLHGGVVSRVRSDGALQAIPDGQRVALNAHSTVAFQGSAGHMAMVSDVDHIKMQDSMSGQTRITAISREVEFALVFEGGLLRRVPISDPSVASGGVIVRGRREVLSDPPEWGVEASSAEYSLSGSRTIIQINGRRHSLQVLEYGILQITAQ